MQWHYKIKRNVLSIAELRITHTLRDIHRPYVLPPTISSSLTSMKSSNCCNQMKHSIVEYYELEHYVETGVNVFDTYSLSIGAHSSWKKHACKMNHKT